MVSHSQKLVLWLETFSATLVRTISRYLRCHKPISNNNTPTFHSIRLTSFARFKNNRRSFYFGVKLKFRAIRIINNFEKLLDHLFWSQIQCVIFLKCGQHLKFWEWSGFMDLTSGTIAKPLIPSWLSSMYHVWIMSGQSHPTPCSDRQLPRCSNKFS